MSRPVTDLFNWLPFQGRIQGKPKDRKEIITSKIMEVKIEGEQILVKTKSRNWYRLIDPGYQIDRLLLEYKVKDIKTLLLEIVWQNTKDVVQEEDKAPPNANG